MTKHALPLLFAALLAPLPAMAASSDWVETQGGRLRLVVADAMEADGTLRGALQIDLEPGWKTYWRDPGDAGVPPMITLDEASDVSGVDVQFPVPERFHEETTVWAGYTGPVSLALSFSGARAGQTSHVSADVFLGICEDICIPVQARFDVDAVSEPATTADDQIVASAFDVLPEPASDEFGAIAVNSGSDELLVEAKVPEGMTPTAFFLAASDGYSFTQPEQIEKDGRLYYSVKVLGLPARIPPGPGLHYTLVAGDRAVSGLLPYP